MGAKTLSDWLTSCSPDVNSHSWMQSCDVLGGAGNYENNTTLKTSIFPVLV
jgi:hypothetical protein